MRQKRYMVKEEERRFEFKNIWSLKLMRDLDAVADVYIDLINHTSRFKSFEDFLNHHNIKHFY